MLEICATLFRRDMEPGTWRKHSETFIASTLRSINPYIYPHLYHTLPLKAIPIAPSRLRNPGINFVSFYFIISKLMNVFMFNCFFF